MPDPFFVVEIYCLMSQNQTWVASHKNILYSGIIIHFWWRSTNLLQRSQVQTQSQRLHTVKKEEKQEKKATNIILNDSLIISTLMVWQTQKSWLEKCIFNKNHKSSDRDSSSSWRGMRQVKAQTHAGVDAVNDVTNQIGGVIFWVNQSQRKCLNWSHFSRNKCILTLNHTQRFKDIPAESICELAPHRITN